MKSYSFGLPPLPGLLSLLLFAACHSVSNNILDSFKTVNASIEKSNRDLSDENSFEYYYLEITKKSAKNQEAQKKADTLYSATRAAVGLITEINGILRGRDSIGDNTTISDSLLVHTPLGDSLKKSLLAVSDHCYAGLISANQKPALDSSLSEIKTIRVQPGWSEGNFKNAPSVAVITTLTYMQMECLKAATITLSDINDHIK